MYIVGIAGGSGSGKSTLARYVQKQLEQKQSAVDQCHILQQDWYYKNGADFAHSNGAHINFAHINFDEPAAVDFELLLQHVQQLRAGQGVQVPVYDFCNHRRLKTTRPFAPTKVLIVEGSMILTQPRLRQVLDFSIYIKVSKQTRLQRRMQRDINERARTRDSVLHQFNTFTEPMHKKYVEPSMQYASQCIDGERDFKNLDLDTVKFTLS